MTSIRSFIRHTPAVLLKQFFSEMQSVDWKAPKTQLNKTLFKLMEAFPANRLKRIQHEIDRIGQVAKSSGLKALGKLAPGHDMFTHEHGDMEISCWFYLHEPELFRRTEEVSSLGQYKDGKFYSRFPVQHCHVEVISENLIKSFESALVSRCNFQETVYVEGYWTDSSVYQVMIYRDGLPKSEYKIQATKQTKELVSTTRRPVREHAILFTPNENKLEVIAHHDSVKRRLAELFAEVFLNQEADYSESNKCYTLAPLLNEPTFDTDPRDQIASVDVVMMRFYNKAVQCDCLYKLDQRAIKSIYQLFEQFGNHNPLNQSDYELNSATIKIKYLRQGSNRKRSLPIEIKMPNTCNVTGLSGIERSLGENTCIVGAWSPEIMDRETYDYLIGLMHTPDARLDWRWLCVYHYAIAHELKNNGWLVEIGINDFYYTHNEEYPYYELEWIEGDPDPRYWDYLGDDGWVTVPLDEVKVYQVNRDKFFKLIQQQLDIPSRVQAKERIPEHLWYLGPARHGDKKIHFYTIFGSGSNKKQFELIEELKTEYHNTPALYFCFGPIDIIRRDLPTDIRFEKLKNVLEQGKPLQIDCGKIQSLFSVFHRPLNISDQLKFSSDCRQVTWRGKTESLTKKQAAIFQALVERGGTVHKSQLQAAAQTHQDIHRVMRDRQGKYHPFWQTLIKGTGNGYYYLDLEA